MKVSLTSDQFLQAIVRRATGDWMQRVNAHVKNVTGHESLILYHSNGSTEEQKLALYQQIFAAIHANRPDQLQATVPRGQATAPAEEPESEPTERLDFTPTPKPTPEPEVEFGPLPEPRPHGESEADPEPPELDTDRSDVARKLRELLETVGLPKSKATIDPKQIAAMVRAEADKLREEMQRAFDDAVKSLPPRAVIEIRSEGRPVKEIVGAVHSQLPQVLAWIKSGVPLWLWSPAGSGKTHLAYQVADALGIAPWIISVDETMTLGKLLGFMGADGHYVPGLLYEPCKQGGLVCMDEIDLNMSAIASINAMISNRKFRFPNGELVILPEQTAFLAGANTKGTGAVAGYTARVRLDAATLDRYAIVELKYDEGMELQVACGICSTTPFWKAVEPANNDVCERWVKWVQAVRKDCGSSVLISPRASLNGVKALRAGIPIPDAAEALVFKLVSDDTKTRMLQTNPLPQA